MSNAQVNWLILGLIIVGGLLLIRRVFGMHKRIAVAEETLAVNRKLVEQGGETIALLQAIRDNLDHRTLKN